MAAENPTAISAYWRRSPTPRPRPKDTKKTARKKSVKGFTLLCSSLEYGSWAIDTPAKNAPTSRERPILCASTMNKNIHAKP